VVTSTSRHLTASVVVLDPPGRRVLLVWQRATGKLLFPGGHVDPDEAPGEAAVREVREETSVHVTLAGPAAVPLPGMTAVSNPWMTYEIPAPAKPDRGGDKPAEPAHSHIDLLFIGAADPDAPITAAAEEVTSAGWYLIDDLHHHDVRAEVPVVARLAATQVATWQRHSEIGDNT
jgi:8-oxo-dGTP pyrophosphatase MutT (NUDIX family)